MKKLDMKKWLRPALSTVGLVTLALTARWWLSKLLEFVGANTDLIQGLADLIQLSLWSITGLVTFLNLRQSLKQTEDSDRAKSTDNDNNRAKAVEHLLFLEIQQDCRLLQELLAYDNQELLPDNWRSRFSENRSVWKDLPSRLSLTENITNLLQLVQEFYEQIDAIEEYCRKLLDLKSQILPLESKPRYGGSGILGFDTINLPDWASKYFTESDAIALISSKKKYFKEFAKLKEEICRVLDLGNQIIRKFEFLK